MQRSSRTHNNTEQAKDIKVPNPAHYVGRVIENEAVSTITSMIAAVTVGVFAGSSIHSAFQEDMDEAQADNGAIVLAQHTQDLADLNVQKLQLDLAQAEYALASTTGTAETTTKQELNSLQDAFTEQAHKELVDLYLEGATSEGAAIGEQDFANLHKTFVDIVAEDVDLEELGYNTDIEPAVLHDALSRIDLPESGSMIARHNAVQDANTYMNEQAHDGELLTGLGGVVSGFATMILVMVLSMVGGEKLSNTPSRIAINRRKRHAPKNIKH